MEKENKNFKIQLLKERLSDFLRVFIFLFLICFIVLNFSQIKTIFNYKEVYDDLFQQFRGEENNDKVTVVPQIELSEPVFTEKENGIEIPKIEIEAPLILTESLEEKDLKEALKKGVVHYPQSALPGEQGEVLILGHSAPSGWPKANYNWIFSELNKLEKGDEIYVYFENLQYLYLVNDKIFLNPGEEISLEELTSSNSVLVLLSCWPPGVSQKRIAVLAELSL
jgi:sortase A